MPRSASRPLSMDESVVQVPCRAADTALSRLLAGRPGHESSRWHPVCPGAPERRSKYPAMYSIQKIIDLLLLLGVPSLLFIGAYVLRRPKRELSWEPVLDQRVHCWKWCAYGFIFLLCVPGTTLYRTLIPTGCDLHREWIPYRPERTSCCSRRNCRFRGVLLCACSSFVLTDSYQGPGLRPEGCLSWQGGVLATLGDSPPSSPASAQSGAC